MEFATANGESLCSISLGRGGSKKVRHLVVVPSYQALSGRLKFTVRRHEFNKDGLLLSGDGPGEDAAALETRQVLLREIGMGGCRRFPFIIIFSGANH